jgi:hypothetical protein
MSAAASCRSWSSRATPRCYWEGYDLSLETLATDMMHAPLDLITGLLDTPSRWSASMGAAGQGSAAEVLVGYAHVIARRLASGGQKILGDHDYRGRSDR